MSQNHPLISVVMPVYNGEEYLDIAIESILNQTYKAFKLILIDDASTDNSLKIIKRYSEKDQRVSFLIHQQNLGIIATLNDGLKLATGQYIARMDSDDISYPERFERQVTFLEKHAEIGLLSSSYRCIDETGQSLEIHRPPQTDILIRWHLLFHSAFCHPSVMFRSELIKHAGLYDPEMNHAEDYDLWSRMLLYTKGANVTDILIDRRKSSTQISSVYKSGQIHTADKISMLNMNRLMGNRQFISVQDAGILRSWYYPSEKSYIPNESLELLNKYFAIYQRFIETYQKGKKIKKYFVFNVVHVLNQAEYNIKQKRTFYYLLFKVNILQFIKTCCSILIRKYIKKYLI